MSLLEKLDSGQIDSKKKQSAKNKKKARLVKLRKKIVELEQQLEEKNKLCATLQAEESKGSEDQQITKFKFKVQELEIQLQSRDANFKKLKEGAKSLAKENVSF